MEETPPPDIPLREAPHSDESRVLADLATLHADLEYVAEMCQKLIPMLKQSNHDATAQALWHSSVIFYGRCFATGRRAPLTLDDIRGLGAKGAEDFHRWILDLRNKHVAHSVNVFDNCKVGFAVGGEPEAADSWIWVGTLLATRPLPPLDTALQLAQLSQLLVRCVDQKADDARRHVTEQVQALDPEQVNRQPTLEVSMPPPDRVTRTR